MRLAGMCIICLSLAPLGSRLGAAQTLEFQGACVKGVELTIAAGGDLLFHRSLQRQAYRSSDGSKRFFTPIKEFLMKSDIAYANLEGPTAHGVAGFGRVRRDPGRRLDLNVYNGYPAFNYHPSIINGLVHVGFDVVSTANNHALDRGAIGIDRTIVNLDKRGLAHTGTRPQRRHSGPPAMTSWPTIVRRKGFSTAWLACTEMTNGLRDRKKQVLMCYRDRKIVLNEISRLRARYDVDAVIVTPHWGVQYDHRPGSRQRKLAREIIEAGATAVIGSHPHVVQPWEKVTTKDGREGLVIYSTGNFISGQVRFMRRAGILAFLRLVKSPDSVARISSVGYIPTWVTFAGGHRIIPNEGKRGSASALRKMSRILPPGNRIKARWPLVLPGKCRPAKDNREVVGTIGVERHPRVAAIVAVELIRDLQVELERVGCVPGKVDGVWGKQSQTGLARFVRYSGFSGESTPSRQLLKKISEYSGDVCPSIKRSVRTVLKSRRVPDKRPSHALPFQEDR